MLPRSRVHVSVVAHVAAAHFCEHQPYHRIEKQLERIGVSLPRSTQVSLMEQLDARVAPMVEAIRRQVWKSGYIHLDATPIDQLAPDRPGGACEATLWAYRVHDGPYLLGQQAHLRRCLSEAPARLDSNPVERQSARSRSAPRTGCSSATPTLARGWPISSP